MMHFSHTSQSQNKEDDAAMLALNIFTKEKLLDVVDVTVDAMYSNLLTYFLNLCCLKIYKAASVNDGLSRCILKALSKEITFPFTMMFSKSLRTGPLPMD